MQVILLERVAKLGQMGEVVKVKDGFARNYLLPQGKALRASEERLRATLEYAPNVAVQWFDRDGRVLYWNHASATLYGPYSDIDTYLANTNSALTEYISSGHDTGRDSFYEMSIPLASIGLTKATLEANGLGVFINVGSASSLDTLPNDSSTLNTPGVTGSNSSWEWEDGDQFTVPFARVAK